MPPMSMTFPATQGFTARDQLPARAPLALVVVLVVRIALLAAPGLACSAAQDAPAAARAAPAGTAASGERARVLHDVSDDGELRGPDAVATSAEITAADIEHHVHALADDAFAGRATGSKESLCTAKYLAAVLKAAGLRGAGDGGGFLQVTDTSGIRSKD